MWNRLVCIAILMLAGIGLTQCNSSGNDTSVSAVIKGNLQFPSADKIYFYSYANTADLYLGEKSIVDSSVVDGHGNFSFLIQCKTPSVFDLMCGNNLLVANLFINHGDEIRLNFIGKGNKPEIFPSSPAAKYNTYLLMFLDTFYRESATRQEYYIGTNYMDVDGFTAYNDERKRKQLNLFTRFFNDDAPAKEFKEYALSTINYGIAVDRLMYVWKKRMKGENVKFDSSYFEFETETFIENIEALNCPAYIRFLNLYIKDVYERMVELGRLPLDKSGALIPQVEKYKLAGQLLKKPFCDVVFYNIIIDDMNYVTEKRNSNHASTLPLDSLISWFVNRYGLK